MLEEKHIPAEPAFEAAAIDCILLEPSLIEMAVNEIKLKPEHFFSGERGTIYRAMVDIHASGGVIEDTVLQSAVAKYNDRIYASYSGTAPSALNARAYFIGIKRAAFKRDGLIKLSTKVAELAYSDITEDEALADIHMWMQNLEQDRIAPKVASIKEHIQCAIKRIDDIQQNGLIPGLLTGYTMLDKILGGFQDGRFYIIAARPAMGKSSLALGVAQRVAKKHNAKVAFFALEMSNNQLTNRLLSMESGISVSKLNRGEVEPDEWTILLEVANQMSSLKLYIDDTSAVSVNDIRVKAKQLMAEDGLDMIVIDYIQLMSGGSARQSNGENRQQEISSISRGLKNLARELDIPIIALSQLSRAVESRTDKRPMLSDLRESGCLTGDTLVTLSNGDRVRIDSVKPGDTVFSLNTNTWKLEESLVSNAFCTGKKPVFLLKTASGNVIRSTANHKFLTINGWKRLDNLAVGEAIAAPRSLNVVGKDEMSDDELALLGHLIGDGCTLSNQPAHYTTGKMELAELVCKLATSIFGDEIKPRIVPQLNGNYIQVYLSSTRKHTHGVRSALTEWLDGMGAWGKRHIEKIIPERVFLQSERKISVFLRHLWSTDGCISFKGKSLNVHYASTSIELIRGVKELLTRLGVQSTIREAHSKNSVNIQYSLCISSKSNILRFIEKVGALGVANKQIADRIVEHYRNTIENTNIDIIEKDIWSMYVKPAMNRNSITQRELHRRINTAYAGTSIFKQNVSRDRASKIAKAVQCDVLLSLAESDVYWDKIVSIESDSEEDVYDLTVPGNHNFVANGLIPHNSLEQDADVVMFIYREDYYIEDTDRQNIADIIVAKDRDGETGTVSMYFRKELTKFENLEIQRTEFDQ